MSRRTMLIWAIGGLIGVLVLVVIWRSGKWQAQSGSAAAKGTAQMVPEQRKTERDMDLEVIANSVKHGDLVDVPRAIEHFAYFPKQSGAEQFGTWCKRSAFRVDETAPREKGEWVVRFSKVGALTIEEVTAQREAAAMAATEAGGAYDGWETVIMKKRK